MTEVFRIFAHECAAPLRVFVMAAGFLFGVTGLIQWYARLAKDRAEQVRRLRLLFVIVMAGAAAMHFWMFTSTCAAGASCVKSFDLNCSGSYPRVYESLALVAIAVAFATIVVEVIHRIRRIV